MFWYVPSKSVYVVTSALRATVSQPYNFVRDILLGRLGRVRDRWGAGAVGDTTVDMSEYRTFVESLADGVMPSQIFLNRDEAHAAIVIEFILRKAVDHVRIVTNRLSPEVYGTEGVLSAAQEFLERNPKARIDILAEHSISYTDNIFLSTLESAPGFAERVTLRLLPSSILKLYKFNFAVADAQHYRYEESRASCEAMAQFGEKKFGAELESTFKQLESLAHVA